MKEPTVAVIAPWLMGGGAQRAMEQLIIAIDPRRTTVYVLFEGSTGLQRIRDLGAQVVDLRAARTPRGLLALRPDLKNIFGNHRKIYSLMRASHLPIGLLPRRVLSSASVLVASFHQLPSSDARGLIGQAENLLVRRAVRRATLVTTPSHRAVAEIAAYKFADPSRIVYEPNLLPTEERPLVPPRPGTLPQLRLLFAGRLTRQKALDRLPALLDRTPLPVHLRIAGDGPEREALITSLAESPRRHTVDFLGEVEDVVPEIDWSDAIVMPSRAELNPLIIWEARRRGRLAITSDISVFSDLGKDGGILEFTDPDEFAQHVSELSTNAAAREGAYVTLPNLGSFDASQSEIVRILKRDNA